ncbi:hypothetical protein OM076_37495 [Solirubrobacter ginsenosidimutans]|uniref:Allene oxide cyclase barrel-like domain-containing protein n=1 Tax=Solirubrobacter ginsenosidimutans TaxID=490573 RepID=A0A9X3S3R8_9ACTN|nr:hypothetical protein [Solirubrobacter ginsenosidimutans]MDA0166020.1 hypothetical protein [Solirubrobacter ginsenosidimutans]
MRIKRWSDPAVAAVVALAVLAAAAPAATGGKGKTLRLVAVQKQQQFIDLAPTGPSLGDQLVFSDTVYRNGREAGTDGAVCSITQIVPPYTVATYQCVATIRLRNGQITVQGLNEFQGQGDPGPFRFAITGGTGTYSGASGEVVVRYDKAGKGHYTLRFDARKNHRR